jgi:hypothetical protein
MSIDLVISANLNGRKRRLRWSSNHPSRRFLPHSISVPSSKLTITCSLPTTIIFSSKAKKKRGQIKCFCKKILQYKLTPPLISFCTTWKTKEAGQGDLIHSNWLFLLLFKFSLSTCFIPKLNLMFSSFVCGNIYHIFLQFVKPGGAWLHELCFLCSRTVHSICLECIKKILYQYGIP